MNSTIHLAHTDPRGTSQYARTSIIIIPVYNTDLVTIWPWSYWHSDTGQDARDIQVTETWVHTGADKFSLSTSSHSGYFGNKRLDQQNVLNVTLEN